MPQSMGDFVGWANGLAVVGSDFFAVNDHFYFRFGRFVGLQLRFYRLALGRIGQIG